MTEMLNPAWRDGKETQHDAPRLLVDFINMLYISKIANNKKQNPNKLPKAKNNFQNMRDREFWNFTHL